MNTPIVYRPEYLLSLHPAGPMTATTTNVDTVQSTNSARMRRGQDAVRSCGSVEDWLTRSA
jgi:hypothetical protein